MLAAIDHQPVDRIPTDIWATPEVWEKLREHFGEGVDPREALHVDGFASIGAPYAGPALESSRRYGWRVRVWDESDAPSAWSEAAFWEANLERHGGTGTNAGSLAVVFRRKADPVQITHFGIADLPGRISLSVQPGGDGNA
jgi:hypothetical protein